MACINIVLVSEGVFRNAAFYKEQIRNHVLCFIVERITQFCKNSV